MSIETQITEQDINDLKTKLINYIKSDAAKNLFTTSSGDYLEQFNNIFDNDKLNEIVLEYLNFIKSLPQTTLLDLINNPISTDPTTGQELSKINRLGGQIIRSIISQLGRQKDLYEPFEITKSLNIFANPDANDYIRGNIPTLKNQFIMQFQWLFNQNMLTNKLKKLKPNQNFNPTTVANVLNNPPEKLSEIVDSLKIFSELNETEVSIAANIFAGIIAKLAGKKSPFTQNSKELPPDLIKAAQKMAINLASICVKNNIFNTPDADITTNMAINLGKAFGKAKRQELYDLRIPNNLQTNYYDKLIDNYKDSLELLNQQKRIKIITKKIQFTIKTKLKFSQKDQLMEALKQDQLTNTSVKRLTAETTAADPKNPLLLRKPF